MNRKLLQLGVEQILTNLSHSRRYEGAVATYWFAKRVQAELLARILTAIPNLDPLNDVVKRFFGDHDAFFKALYECDNLTKLDFWQEDDEGRQVKLVSALVDERESILVDREPPYNYWRTACDAASDVI
jgi:hypothetical protein